MAVPLIVLNSTSTGLCSSPCTSEAEICTVPSFSLTVYMPRLKLIVTPMIEEKRKKEVSLLMCVILCVKQELLFHQLVLLDWPMDLLILTSMKFIYLRILNSEFCLLLVHGKLWHNR